MRTALQGRWLLTAAMGLGLVVASGCQTWVAEAGVTMPSGHYLKHPPQYIPPGPDFPLERELASQEEAAAAEQ